jgi:ASC-1-like (ASCH) protein
MKVISLRIKRKYFFDIQNNLKTLEARCRYPNLRKLKLGDSIQFQWEHLSCTRKIKDIRRYLSVTDMLKQEEISKLLPGTLSFSEAMKIYTSIYTSQKVNQNGGMIVFELE